MKIKPIFSKKKFSLLVILVFCVNSIFSQEEPEKHPILTDKFQADAGLFVPSKSIKIGVDGSAKNADIDFNKNFNLNENETTLFLNFDWRFAKKWKLGVEYFSVKSANTSKLKEDIVFGDITFEKGTNVRGGFGIDMYRMFIGRSFSRGLKHEFGAGLGIHGLQTSAFVAGDLLTSEGDLEFVRRSVSALIPLPNLGVWYYYTPNTKWALTTRLDWFGITVGEYSGGLWDIAPGVKYQIFKHFGVGVDYRYFIVTADVNKSDWNGNFNMTFQGPLFVVYASF